LAKTGRMTVALPVFGDFSVDKSVEFSYEELAMATNDFNVVNKIGEGGFGAVYYGVIRGQVLSLSLLVCPLSCSFCSPECFLLC
jgi:chitin elicitor receptor kinase 1